MDKATALASLEKNRRGFEEYQKKLVLLSSAYLPRVLRIQVSDARARMAFG